MLIEKIRLRVMCNGRPIFDHTRACIVRKVIGHIAEVQQRGDEREDDLLLGRRDAGHGQRALERAEFDLRVELRNVNAAAGG